MSSDAFRQLVDAYYVSLYRFALSLAKNPADASDLTQQTFFVWARKGAQLRDPGKVKAWLFTTLYREFLRGRRRAGHLTALEDLPPGEAEPAAPEVDVVSGLDAGLAVEALHEVDEVYRTPLTLFYLREFSYKEIADTLEVPIGTVMSRLSRGKAQLREALGRRAGPVRNKVLPFDSQMEGKPS